MALFGFSSCLNAQKPVESGAYRLMLKKLLAHSVPEVDVKATSAQQEQLTFLDAREEAEFKVSHIKDAIWVGYDHFDSTKVMELPRNKKIVVYCSVGYRSEKITEKLQSYGFTHVSNLYGGVFEWVNQGHPVVNTEGKTEKIHAFDRIWGVWLRKGEKVYK